jgi:hypothetical protein
MDESAALKWVQDEYGVSPKKTKDPIYGDLVNVYEWYKDDGTYGHLYFHDEHIIRMSLEGIKHGPTFGQVVEELGPPEAFGEYVTRVEDTVYSFSLGYPAWGFSVSGMDSTRGYVEEVVLSKDMRVDLVVCHAPGPREEVLREAYLLDVLYPESEDSEWQEPTPWPGFGTPIRLDEP